MTLGAKMGILKCQYFIPPPPPNHPTPPRNSGGVKSENSLGHQFVSQNDNRTGGSTSNPNKIPKHHRKRGGGGGMRGLCLWLI